MTDPLKEDIAAARHALDLIRNRLARYEQQSREPHPIGPTMCGLIGDVLNIVEHRMTTVQSRMAAPPPEDPQPGPQPEVPEQSEAIETLISRFPQGTTHVHLISGVTFFMVAEVSTNGTPARRQLFQWDNGAWVEVFSDDLVIVLIPVAAITERLLELAKFAYDVCAPARAWSMLSVMALSYVNWDDYVISRNTPTSSDVIIQRTTRVGTSSIFFIRSVFVSLETIEVRVSRSLRLEQTLESYVVSCPEDVSRACQLLVEDPKVNSDGKLVLPKDAK